MKVGQVDNVETRIRFQQFQGSIIKGFILFFITLAFLAYRIVFISDFTQACIFDFLHVFLFPVNRWMDKDPFLIIIQIGQLLIDGFAILIAAVWLWKSNNMRTIHVVAMFYAIRTAYLTILFFPFPDDIVWRAPPIPSILVPYDRTRDFFFSGHTGIAIVLVNQATIFKLPKWIQYIGYLMIAWMPFMLITSRIHYTIDVLAAPFYTALNYDICKWMGKCPDYFWSFPYFAFNQIKTKCCLQPVKYEDNRLVEEIQH